MAGFSLRIVDADYYLEKPIPSLDNCFSNFRQGDIYKVPIIRIFGSTPKGQQSCLHIHSVFPYFYVAVPSDVNDMLLFSKEFTSSLEFALQVGLGRAVSKQQMYVNLVEVVRRKPLYGYHKEELDFLKIYLYNPGLVKKCSEILINGSVLNKVFQPYETHIPYILQFLIDYNLYGMNLIHLKHMQFRLPLPKGDSSGEMDITLTSPLHSPLGSPILSQTNYDVFNECNVSSSMILSDICKQTRCILEADASAMNILNQLYIKDSISVNPGLNGIWEDEKQRRRDNMQSSVIEVVESQSREECMTKDEENQLRLLKIAVNERLNTLNIPSSDSQGHRNEESSYEGSANQTSDILSSSMDESLVHVLADLADDDVISNTPLSESTFINNGLSDKENNTEDDEEIESILMSQQIHYPDEKDPTCHQEELPLSPSNLSEDEEDAQSSWTKTFLNEIPQMDGSSDQILKDNVNNSSRSYCIKHTSKTINNEDVLGSNCINHTSKTINNEEVFGSILGNAIDFKPFRKHNLTGCNRNDDNRARYPIPQLDGNSDMIGSNSDDDFKTKRKRKRKQKSKRKKQRLSFISDYEGLTTSDVFERESYHSDIGRDGVCNVQEKNEPRKGRTQYQTASQRYHSSSSSTAELDIHEFDSSTQNTCNCAKGEILIKKRRKKVGSSYNNKYINALTHKFNLKPFKIVLDDIVKTEIENSESVQLTPISTCENKYSDFENNADKNAKSDLNEYPSTYYIGEYEFTSNNTFYYDALHTLSFPSPNKTSYDNGKLPCYAQTFLSQTNIDSNLCSISINPHENINISQACEQSIACSTFSCFQDNAMSSLKASKVNVENCCESQYYDQNKVIPIQESDVNFLCATDNNQMENKLSSNGSDGSNTTVATSVNVDVNIINATPNSSSSEHSNTPQDTHSGNYSIQQEATQRKVIILTPEQKPPSREYILQSLVQYNLCEVNNMQPFYSKEGDTGSKTGVYHGQHVAKAHCKVTQLPRCVLSTSSDGALENLKEKQESILKGIIDVDNLSFQPSNLRNMYGDKHITITPCKLPPHPTKTDYPQPNVKNDAGTNIQLTVKSSNDSEIEGVTLNNTYGFDITHHNLNEAKTLHVNQHLTVVSIELHVMTRRAFKPDPTMDAISAIFYYISKDTTNEDQHMIPETGIFLVDSEYCSKNKAGRSDEKLQRSLSSEGGISSCVVHTHSNEKELILKFASFIQQLDPDIIIGYEVQMLSWGYLIERAATLGINICQMLSRVIDHQNEIHVKGDTESDFNFGTLINMSISGRIILNVWRIMRSEVTLQLYSFENVFYHIVHQRVPSYSFALLSEWWTHGHLRWRVCNYYIIRCQGNIKLLNQIDFINRTSELARLFGMLFYSVISRGSQFRVESMMLRVAKPLNFIPVSPSVHQRAKMPAPECIPLVIEPESCFYADPVIVLDFQSLYPSIIIAYNYCYSTCLGKVQSFSLNEHYNFGATSLNLPLSVLKKLMKKDIHISPNGIGFVKSNVVKGVLPKMLEEILNTRIMVKGSMKLAKGDKVLYKMLDSRQLGLKLIANFTYGYTSANFSGRMPCIEIGDSIVRKARETLERAIDVVHSTKKWNAKVVYGDTDSLFILLKGASKSRAFAIAKEMVDEVTANNPKPVKLIFEKVYQPCVLISKKRYVGYMYETLSQNEPVFDAKGIETVRRDNCPAVGKILEKSIRILFEKKDVSLIKAYVQKQFVKIMEEKVILKDFIFAKEYNGMNRYKPGACVPSLSLSRKMLKDDRRSEPRIGERVPYVVVYGSPGLPLIQLVRMPLEVINSNSLRLNGVYYITKQVAPALSRIFNLFGVNVMKWFTDLPKVYRSQDLGCDQPGNSKGMISQYFTSNHCVVCEKLTNHHLCPTCRSAPQHTAITLNCTIRISEKRLINLTQLCQHCSGIRDKNNGCISIDCPIFYKLCNTRNKLQKNDLLRNLLVEL